MSKEPREYFEDKCAAWINEIKAENVPWDPGADEYREITNLRIQPQDVEKKLHEMRTAVDAVWPAIRDEMEAGLSTLSQAVSQKLSIGKR